MIAGSNRAARAGDGPRRLRVNVRVASRRRQLQAEGTGARPTAAGLNGRADPEGHARVAALSYLTHLPADDVSLNGHLDNSVVIYGHAISSAWRHGEEQRRRTRFLIIDIF